jgi:hypothetical protein
VSDKPTDKIHDFILRYRALTRTPGSIFYPAPVEMEALLEAVEVLLAEHEKLCSRYAAPIERVAFIAKHGTSPVESICQWGDDCFDMNAETCSNTATHTTCDPVGAVVCAEHKCRCSKPLGTKVTCDRCKTLYVPGERHGCIAKDSTEEETKP